MAQTPPETWRRHIQGLRPNIPLAGMPFHRWRTYCEDAHWLIEAHGAELAAARFTIVDLFQLIPGRAGAGGLVELLRGARAIIITERTASFRCGRVTYHIEASGGDRDATGWTGPAPWQPR